MRGSNGLPVGLPAGVPPILSEALPGRQLALTLGVRGAGYAKLWGLAGV